MNFVVLVKQVPDVSNIPEDAWDREKGTLRRGVLESVLNPLDLHALTLACQIRWHWNDPTSRVVCLTMGPPQSRDILTECISRGADQGVLLTDRAFSGADTCATAYSIGQAIRKMEREIFNGAPYIIVSGMQSVDGDTAQVPAQVAEELGIEHIAYAQSFAMQPRFSVRRIGPSGAEVVAPETYPVLITVTAATQPLYRSFHRTRGARSTKLIEWNAADVQAAPNRVGIPGSRTTVFRIYSPTEEKHKECKYFEDADQLVEALDARIRQGAAKAGEEEAAPYRLDGKPASYKGQVWVFVEQQNGVAKSVGFELVAEARKLAISLNEQVGAVLLGHEVETLAPSLIARGADVVYVVDHPLLRQFIPIPYKKAIVDLVAEFHPQIMLFGATPLGRELAPRVAYASNSGLTADCTKLEISDFQRGNTSLVAILKQTRPALGGNIMATIMTKDSQTQMATVRPGVFKAAAADPARAGSVIRREIPFADDILRTKILSVEELAAKSGIADAQIVVSGGRGVGSKAKFDRHIRQIAAAIDGVWPGRVEVGASRMAVEDGYIGHDHQVGQTGQTIQPKLYIALGISGAVQHVSGMQNAEIIVVINKDPHARIFNYADFGMVGDVDALAPKLAESLQRRKRS